MKNRKNQLSSNSPTFTGKGRLIVVFLAVFVASVLSVSAQNEPYIGIYGTVVGGRLAGNAPFYGTAQVDTVSAGYPDANDVTQQAQVQSPIIFSGSAVDGFYSDTIALRTPDQLRIQAAAPEFLYYSYFDNQRHSLYEVHYEGGTTAYIRNYRDYITIFGPFPANTSIPVLVRARVRGTIQTGPANQGYLGRMAYYTSTDPILPRNVDVSVWASANFGVVGRTEFSASVPGTSQTIDVIQEYPYTALSLVAGQTPPIMYPGGQLTMQCNNGASGDLTVSFEIVIPRGYTVTSQLGTAGTVVYSNARPSFTDEGDVTAPNSGPQSFPNWATDINPGAPDESDQALDFQVSANSNPYLFSVGPAISPEGTLTFTPAPGLIGTANITVLLHDNGGTAIGGIDSSVPHTFAITVNGVDTPPTVTSVTAESPYEVLVKWSEPVTAPSATTTANYMPGGGLAVSSAILVNPITVRLRTSRQTESTTYSLHIGGVQDTTGHSAQLDTNFRSLQFVPGQIRLRTWPDDAGVFSAFASEEIADRSPTRDETLPGYFSGENLGDVYFGQLRGWFTPDVTDSHVFFCASDDDSELYLSTDENPANKVRIASVAGWTSAREWNKYSTQRSASIPLQAGQRYYLELVWREGGGGDHGAVAVKRATAPDPANGGGELAGNRVGNFVPSLPDLTRCLLTLGRSPLDGGTIQASPPPDADGKYAIGTVVTLTALPATGFAFTDWTGDSAGTLSTLSITLIGDADVTANFRHLNSAPIAIPGGPYTINQGEALQLDASASFDPDTGETIIRYSWDLNTDGVFDWDTSTAILDLSPDDLLLSGLTAGTYTVTLRVFDQHEASATASTTLTIRRTQTITFGQIPPHTYGDAPFTVPVSASSGLPVTLISSDPSVATISGNALTIVGAGNTLITASQSGDAHYQPATPVANNLTVAKASSTLSWAAPVPIQHGTALSAAQLNATANVPGTFTYTPSAGTVLDTGSQTLSVAFAPNDAANYLPTSGTVPISVLNNAPVASNDGYQTDERTLLRIDSPGLLSNDLDSDEGPLLQFTFRGQIYASNEDFTAGEEFEGYYLVDPLTPPGAQLPDGGIPYDAYQNMALVWEVWFPSSGYHFQGYGNRIRPGNNTPDGDFLYVALDHGSSGGTPLPSGRQLSGVSLEMRDPVDFGQDLLQDNSIQTTTIDVASAAIAYFAISYSSGPAFFSSRITEVTGPKRITSVNGLAANVDRTITLSSGATLRVNGNGSFSYDPRGHFDYLVPGATALDTFSYAVSDREGAISTATATITVTGVNNQPVLVSPIPNQNRTYGQVFQFTIPANTFSDVDAAQVLTWSAAPLPPGLTFDPSNQTFSGIPASTGSFDITVTATDNDANPLSAISVFRLEVAKADLTVVAGNQSRVFGQPNPPLTGTVTGLVNGDYVTATYGSPASATSPAGFYSIDITLQDPNNRLSNYNVTTIPGILQVDKATPIITWPAPPDSNCHIPLSSAELNATADVPGTFVYSPPAGTLLSLGNGQILSVHFTPADTANYNDASSTTAINVRLDGGAVVAWERTPPDSALVSVGIDNSGQVGVAGYSWVNGFDYYIAKYASVNGAVIWETRYNGAANAYDEGMAGTMDGGGNIIVTGRSYNGPFNTGNADYLTAKYASVNGTLLWEHRYNSPFNGEDVATHVAVDTAGNVIVSGYSHNGSSYDIYTAKYAATDGSLLWERRYNDPGNGQDYPRGIAVGANGDIVITGASESDFYTAKYASADGSVLWEQRYDSRPGGDDQPMALALDSSGNAIVTGFSNNGSSGYDFYTAKYSSDDGALLWEKRYNGTSNVDEFATDVKVDADGNIFVTGERSNGSTFDYLTVKYAAADGTLLWERPLANHLGFLEGQPRLAVLANGNVVFTGLIKHFDNSIEDYTASYGSADGTLRWEDRAPANSNIPRPIAVDNRNDVVTSGPLTVFYQVGAQPVVTLVGNALMSIEANSVFIDPGATAIEGCGGSLAVTVVGSVDVQTPGTYLLTYSATDAAGQKASIGRMVTVGKITPVITWANPADIIYGTALGSAQLNATASAPGSFTYSPAAGTILSAGTAQSIQVLFVPTDTQKFAPASRTVSINVLKAPASLAFSGLNQTYDATPKTVTVLTTPAGLSGTSVTYAGSPAAPINAGSYPVNASLNHPNYSASPASASLVIAKANQTISFTTPANATYGSDLLLTGTTSSGLPVTYTVSGPATLTGNLLHFTALGTVSVTVAQPGNANFNAATPVTRSITVNKAVLTVKADDKAKVFGQMNPALSYIYAGFVNGDTASVVRGAPSLSTTVAATTPVGSYPINIAAGNLSAANYSFALVSGTMRITAANTTVTAANANGKFGAASVTLSASVQAVSPSGATVNEGTVSFIVRNTGGVQIGQTVTGSVSKGGVSASFPTSTLAKGTYSIYATYSDALSVPNLNGSTVTSPGTLTLK